METGTHAPNLNGHYPAPLPSSSGALYSARPAQANPTVFPEEIGGWSPRLLLYWLGWAQLGEISLLRWVWVAGVVVSIALAIAPVPGKWWLVVMALGALAVLTLARPFLARGHFVRFSANEAESSVDAPPAPLAPSKKVPVHVTGILEVGGREQRFVALPGFYRTFATREHALLCLCRDRRILGVGVPPERDLGLWYAFFDSGQIEQIEDGTIAPGGRAQPTLRIVYQARMQKQRGTTVRSATLYITAASVDELRQIEADLRHDWRRTTPESSAAPQPNPAATSKA